MTLYQIWMLSQETKMLQAMYTRRLQTPEVTRKIKKLRQWMRERGIIENG